MPKKLKPAAVDRSRPVRRTRKDQAIKPSTSERAAPLVKKMIKWMGDSKEVMSAFPDDVKQAGGEELFRLQCGLDAYDATPIGSVGPGTYEIRISKGGGWFRVFYVAKFANALYVLHAFQKKTNATSKVDIEVGKVRYALAEADAQSAAMTTLQGKPAKAKR